MSWEPVWGSPNTVLIKGFVDWTDNHGHIPQNTPVGGIIENKQPLNFGDGASTSAALRIISRDAATNDVLTEFMSDHDKGGTIESNEVGVLHTYIGSGPFRISCQDGNRTDALNLDTATWRQEMTGDLSLAGNSSPIVATPAVVQLADDKVFTYRIAATDPDGDTLRFRYGTKDEFYGTGGSGEATRPTDLVLADDGIITWDVRDSVLNTVPGDRWQVTVMVEDLDANGNVKSSVPVDFALKIASATA